jgi:hypothetical protein
MTELTPELRAHIASKKIADELTELTKDLVDTTNVMGGDDYIAQSIMVVLENVPKSNAFIALLQDSIPYTLERLSPYDGRVEATHAMLTELNKDIEASLTSDVLAKAFAKGVTSCHSTLIQSFYRIIITVAVAKQDNAAQEKLMDKCTMTGSYLAQKERAELALTNIINLLSDIELPETYDPSVVLGNMVNKAKYLPFI